MTIARARAILCSVRRHCLEPLRHRRQLHNSARLRAFLDLAPKFCT